MPAKTPRNRAAQDATLINLRALAKRVAALEQAVKALATPQPRDDHYWLVPADKALSAALNRRRKA